MTWVYDDGGRSLAGYRGETGDCVCRSIAIATGMAYADVYAALNEEAKSERRARRSSARTGVHMTTIRRYLERLGWEWTPTMGIGTGCKVHLDPYELPTGRLIIRTSGHITAMIDGVIHDTHDPSREGTRCVYGYWQKTEIVRQPDPLPNDLILRTARKRWSCKRCRTTIAIGERHLEYVGEVPAYQSGERYCAVCAEEAWDVDIARVA